MFSKWEGETTHSDPVHARSESLPKKQRQCVFETRSKSHGASGPDNAGLVDYQIRTGSLILRKAPLTEVVNHIPITPLRSIRTWPIRIIKRTSSQEQIIDLIRTKLGKSLLSKDLHTTQTLQVKRKNMNRVRGRVEVERVVCSLGGLGVSGTEDESVRLGLLEELLDGLEAL